MMVTMVDTSARPIQPFWTRSVLQLIVQATITVVKSKNVRKMSAKTLIVKPMITAESNKSANKDLSPVRTLSAVTTNTARVLMVHTDVMVERTSTNVSQLNACPLLTAEETLVILFVKKTNAYHKNVEKQNTVKKNSADPVNCVNPADANVKRKNVFSKNAKHTRTVLTQTTNTVLIVSKTNVSLVF